MTELQANKVAMVTGGSRGIGRAICLRLAEDGWPLAVGYAREKEAAEDVVKTIGKMGRRAVAIQADMGDPSAIPLLFRRASEALGPLGLFVANAGMTGDAIRIDRQTIQKLRRLIDVNLLGTMPGAGEAVRRLSTRHGGTGGVIILLSSVSVRLDGRSGQVAYAGHEGRDRDVHARPCQRGSPRGNSGRCYRCRTYGHRHAAGWRGSRSTNKRAVAPGRTSVGSR